MLDRPLVLSPADFVALSNQVLEQAFPFLIIEGELSELRVSKGRWLYFKLKDAEAIVSCFGTVQMMPGPLEDGLVVQVAGYPRLHPRFGFSFQAQRIAPVGQGSIQKAHELLRQRLEQEGLLGIERKRPLPYPPAQIALVTSAEGAALTDFKRILLNRWPFAEVVLFDALVQGQDAPQSLVQAIQTAAASNADVMVVTRGGGGAEDLGAFNDERVVRAIAASRIPTLVAIGHERDESLAELVADMRASTPSNAAELLVPDQVSERVLIKSYRQALSHKLATILQTMRDYQLQQQRQLDQVFVRQLSAKRQQLAHWNSLLQAVDPSRWLERGGALVSRNGQPVKRAVQLNAGDLVELRFVDGRRQTKVV